MYNVSLVIIPLCDFHNNVDQLTRYRLPNKSFTTFKFPNMSFNLHSYISR